MSSIRFSRLNFSNTASIWSSRKDAKFKSNIGWPWVFVEFRLALLIIDRFKSFNSGYNSSMLYAYNMQHIYTYIYYMVADHFTTNCKLITANWKLITAKVWCEMIVMHIICWCYIIDLFSKHRWEKAKCLICKNHPIYLSMQVNLCESYCSIIFERISCWWTFATIISFIPEISLFASGSI